MFVKIKHIKNIKASLCWISSPVLLLKQAYNFTKKETPPQVFSCEFFKNTSHFYTEHFRWLLLSPDFFSDTPSASTKEAELFLLWAK